MYFALSIKMAFKPDRSKLNAKFDGYKLGKRSLPFHTQPFEEGVRVAKLKEEDYSYQHVRTFSLYNHLAVDPWDGRSVYWCASNGAIFRGQYAGSHGVQVKCIYQCSTTLSPTHSSVNPSLSFISESLCLFSNGCGPLHLLHTPSRTPTSRESSEVEKEGATWQLLEELKLLEMESKPFSILSAHYKEADCLLDVAALVLDSAAIVPVGSEKPVSKPPIATYHWYRFNLNVGLETLAHLTESQCSAGSKGSLETEIQLACSLNSCTVALYGTFVSDHLVILSEAEVTPAHQLTTTEETDDSKDSTEGEVKLSSATDHVAEESDASDEEEDNKSKKFAGLGFEGSENTSRAQPQYKWSQTDSDVTITVSLPEDVTKHDVHCVIDRQEVVVGLTDGTTYFRDRLYAPVNPECSTWTIEKHTLEVSLEKQHEMEWPSLKEDEKKGEGGATSLPLRGPVADQLSQQELDELQRKISEVTKSDDALPAAKRHHPCVQSTQYEECDISEGEDATFFVITQTSDILQKVPLAGRQFLFSSPSLPHSPPIFCLKHDVDALLWQPQRPTHDSSNTILGWSHMGTFNALAYVQAARQDKKFTVCPPSMKFAALCDCNRHVFVYLQPEEGVKGNSAVQYVVTLQSVGDILGLQATDDDLIFVLKENELHVIVVSPN